MEYRLTTFEDLSVGQRAFFSRAIFGAITEDVNPVHENEEHARGTLFGPRIGHGMLSASLFSIQVGMLLPGAAAICRSQTLEFSRPVRVGDALTAVSRPRNSIKSPTGWASGAGSRTRRARS